MLPVQSDHGHAAAWGDRRIVGDLLHGRHVQAPDAPPLGLAARLPVRTASSDDETRDRARGIKLMSGSASTAMDDHLQRFGTSNENGNDSDDSSSSTCQRGETSSHQSAAGVSDIAERDTSFWSTVFADTSRPLPNTVRGSNLEEFPSFLTVP